MTDADAIQPSSLGRQYAKVEKESKKLTQELRSFRRKRRQLEAEVRFLHHKLRFFKRHPDHDGCMQVCDVSLGDLSPASRDQQHFTGVVDTSHQFYEVEVKFADHFNSLDNGVMESAPLITHPTVDQSYFVF